MGPRDNKVDSNPLWYKDAVIYEVHIRSFYDSDDDGIGDIRGLVEKLDYLQALGVTAVWLLPFYPSPLKDDGYDIADYFRIHPDYGTLRDFRQFLREAHKRGIRVITELVINHTSDQHAWFRRSRRSRAGSKWRDFYVWSDTPDKYRDARVIFQDFEHSNWTWDSAAGQYYWHRFYNHQPDLNYDNPRLRQEILRVVDFWFGMGVDGMRLDAVPYLYQREGTNCENLPEVHAFLRELRSHVDEKFQDKMLLAEANQWPEDAAEYFGDGDECHMAFNFPVMPRLFMALRMEDRFPVIDMVEQSGEIPEGCQWAIFLRNHDELTLEMVTDEERDYMYRAYASDPKARINVGIRRRLAPLLENDRRRIELLNVLLLSLPGTPVLYYGDELGMGDNYYLGDRQGVRTPMQWSPDRNAGFSKTNPQRLFLPVVADPEYHYTAVNVETQERNQSSLLWWMRQVIALRKKHKAFGHGDIRFLRSDNTKVLSFVRSFGDEQILVVANLSGWCQSVQLDVSDYRGCVPEEMFSGNGFPEISSGRYPLAMGPYNTYWFVMKQPETAVPAPGESGGEVVVAHGWENFFSGETADIERVLRDYMLQCRWFGGKGRRIRKVAVSSSVRIESDGELFYLVTLDVSYTGAPRESYLLPIGLARMHESLLEALEESPRALIGRSTLADGVQGVLYDAVYSRSFRDALLAMIAGRRTRRSGAGGLTAVRGRKLRAMTAGKSLPMESRVLNVEQSNSSAVYDESFFLKLYRRIESGINPDAELSRALTEQTRFGNLSRYAGSLEIHSPGREPQVAAMLQEYVRSEGDAWEYSLNSLQGYYKRVIGVRGEIEALPEMPASVMEAEPQAMPEIMQQMIGVFYLDMARLLGQRTAEMHLALASLRGEGLEPEEFSVLYQKSMFQSMRSLALTVFENLGEATERMEGAVLEKARGVLGRRGELISRMRRIVGGKLNAMKIRIHGDYHLGQVLWTGKDLVIIDFEGEPARTLGERRLKRSPLRDVAGMLRSFHYAARGALTLHASVYGEHLQELTRWADLWYHWAGGAFLQSYLAETADSAMLPEKPEDFERLLEGLLLEKAVYELGYELNNWPEWIEIPLAGIEQLLGVQEAD